MFCIRQPVTSTHRKHCLAGKPPSHNPQSREPESDTQISSAAHSGHAESAYPILCTNKGANSVKEGTFITTRDKKEQICNTQTLRTTVSK